MFIPVLPICKGKAKRKGKKEYRERSQSWWCNMKNVQLSSNVERKLDKHCSLASWAYGLSNTWHFKISQNVNWKGMEGAGGGRGGAEEMGQTLYFTFSSLSIRYNGTIVNPNHFRPRSRSWKDPISPSKRHPTAKSLFNWPDLHAYVNLLQRPESFRVLLSCAN